MQGIREEQSGGLSLWRLSFLEDMVPVVAIFSSRRGGISLPPYDSLNLAFHVGDLPPRVLKNRMMVAQWTGLPLHTWIAAQQVHGDRVAVVTREEAGRGALEPYTSLPFTDGLLTRERGITLVAFFADCAPIYLAHPQGAIGLVHAGWRGTAKGIA